jgi:hypothetical protein
MCISDTRQILDFHICVSDTSQNLDFHMCVSDTNQKLDFQRHIGRLFCISTAALITNIPLTSLGNEMKFTEKIEKELI